MYISPVAISRMDRDELDAAKQELCKRRRDVMTELDEIEDLLLVVEEREGSAGK